MNMRISFSACKQPQPLVNFPGGLSLINLLPRHRRKEKAVVVVMGGTGTGKSRLSIELATRFDAEVINSDKMQVYKGLDIVTNKVTDEDCGNQIASLDSSNNDQDQEDFDVFTKHVGDRFSALLPAVDSPCAAAEPPPLLTLSWFHDLLDAFLCCESEFKAVLLSGREPSQFSRPPLDRLVPDLLDRSVKALDVLNAVTNGFDLVRHWLKLAQIAVAALQQAPVGDGQVRRARKEQSSGVTVAMDVDDVDSSLDIFGEGPVLDLHHLADSDFFNAFLDDFDDEDIN